jgi:predicted alpha/beta superfamily hydrolase
MIRTLALVAAAMFALSADAVGAAAPAPAPYVLPFTATHRLHSAINGVDYTIYVRVPPGYARSIRRYPVIYLLDADYQFALAANTVEHLADRMNQAPQAIVVAIAYSGAYPDRDRYRRHRSRDYTPWFVPTGGYGPEFQKNSGGAPKFLRVIEREVFPLVERAYRADAADRTIVGHSYGGLFASWVLQERPDLFRRYLIVSGSLWYDKERILRNERMRAGRLARPTYVYLAIGSYENHPEPGMDMVEQTRRFARLLDARRDPNLVVRHRVFEDETHASIFPAAFSTGIRHLFGEMEQPGMGGD